MWIYPQSPPSAHSLPLTFAIAIPILAKDVFLSFRSSLSFLSSSSFSLHSDIRALLTLHGIVVQLSLSMHVFVIFVHSRNVHKWFIIKGFLFLLLLLLLLLLFQPKYILQHSLTNNSSKDWLTDGRARWRRGKGWQWRSIRPTDRNAIRRGIVYKSVAIAEHYQFW